MNRVKSNLLKSVFVLAVLLMSIQLVLGQTAPAVTAKAQSAETVTLKLKSSLMGREMPYRVIIPANYKAKPESRFAVIYLLHGLTGHYNNWTDRTRLAEYALMHQFIVVTPEGDNGWYTDAISIPNDKYESYILKELIPEIDKQYRTVADRDHRFIAGLSMGGYGAVKFGLKYPAMFSVVGSFSGALGAAGYNETSTGAIGKSMAAVFGPANSETRRTNDIFSIVRELTPERLKLLPFIYQSCGTEDFLIQNNRDFVALLVEKKVPHEYRQHPGGHTWPFWDTHVREFLDLVSRRMKK